MPWVRRHRRGRKIGVLVVAILVGGALAISAAVWSLHLVSSGNLVQTFMQWLADLR